MNLLHFHDLIIGPDGQRLYGPSPIPTPSPARRVLRAPLTVVHILMNSLEAAWVPPPVDGPGLGPATRRPLGAGPPWKKGLSRPPAG